jgi:transcriptional regulator of acetoin/glycerol metabolism
MSDKVTVPVTMPRHVWGRLASVADKRGVTVADVIASAVAANITVPKPRERAKHPGAVESEHINEQLRALLARGATPADIAARLGVSRSAVYNRITKHKLRKVRAYNRKEVA